MGRFIAQMPLQPTISIIIKRRLEIGPSVDVRGDSRPPNASEARNLLPFERRALLMASITITIIVFGFELAGNFVGS